MLLITLLEKLVTLHHRPPTSRGVDPGGGGAAVPTKILYRQKYLPTKHWEESHVSNAKYEKIGSLRSLAIKYFQLGIIVKKGHAINYSPWRTGDSAPSTPDKQRCRSGGGGAAVAPRPPPQWKYWGGEHIVLQNYIRLIP